MKEKTKSKENTETKGRTTKRLPLNKTYFEANGNKYTIVDSLCIERWRHLEDLQDLMGWGRGFDEMFKLIKQAYELLDQGKHNEPRIILHNLLHGIKQKIENRYHPALMLCTLFVIREGEDQTIYDEEYMKTKIVDWTKEGYDINDFFQLAWTLVPGFIKHYQDDLASSLKNLTPEQLEVLSKGKK